MRRLTMNPIRYVALAACGAVLSACALGPDYHVPKVTIPDAFVAAPALAPASSRKPSPGAAEKGPAQIDPAVWWRSFGDSELDSLVERAIKSNPDIEIALDRLQEARTQEAVVMGRALPEAG